MRPTEILSQEHRVIKVVLDCLEQMANVAAETQQIEEPAVRQAIDFFRHFADGCHHAKEENQLFPAMESKGFDRKTGPLSIMLDEHNAGRDAVGGMERAVDDHAQGGQRSVEQFVSHARRFIDLLRQHIEKEDHCLFAMADQALSTEDQSELLARFAQAERDVIGETTKERYLRLAQQLAERYQLDAAPAALPQARPNGCGTPPRGAS